MKKRYETKVVGIGIEQSLTVVPAMIALFQDFPGKSGSTRSVDVNAAMKLQDIWMTAHAPLTDIRRCAKFVPQPVRIRWV